MLNMIRMEIFRMFKTRSMYVIWGILTLMIVFTTSLSAHDFKTYTMEEKQEVYEWAMEQQHSEELNLGMDVTAPTKPGEDVSVFDLFYANVKGKFIALFMVIFAILYSTADTTSGYIKNIAGQVRDRKGLVAAKAVALFVFSVLTFLLFAFVQMGSNVLFLGKFVLGSCKEFLQYAGVQLFLHFVLLMIVMCIAMLLRNNVISIVIGVMLCMNALMIFYGFIEKIIVKAGISDFHIMDYTVSGKIALLPMEVSVKSAGTSLAVGAAFLIVALLLNSVVFQKRDI